MKTKVWWLLGGALALGLSAAACKTDDGAGGGDRGGDSGSGDVQLLRVEIEEGGFDKLLVRAIVAVTNTGSGPMDISGGTVEIALKGKAGTAADDGEGEADDDAADAEDEGDADDDEADEDEAGDDESGDEAAAAPAAEVKTGVYFAGDGLAATVPANSRAEYPIRVEWPLPDDPAALEALLAWKTVSLDIRGTVTRGGATDTFAGERDLTLPEFPTVVLSTAQVASEDGGLKGAAFFVIGIDNPNSFTVNVDAFAWGISVGGKQLQAPGQGSPEIVPAATVAEFEDNVNLNAETYGPEVTTLLSQPNVPYVVDGFIEVAGVRKPIRFEGEMAFAR